MKASLLSPNPFFKAMTTHLSLLKDRVTELNTYLDNRGAVQTVDDHEINTIELKAGWIETKFNKILTQWDGFLDTDYDEVCRRSAGGLLEVCRRSAGSVPSSSRAYDRITDDQLKEHLG